MTDVYGDFYHEALVHVAMAQLGPSDERQVLLIGGGDGGAARQVLQYPSVQVLQVEIDEMVVQSSQEFFGANSVFGHPRHRLILADAVRWVEDHWKEMQGTFDLCIIDSTDEPLASVWSVAFYQELKSMLKSHGVVVQNVGSQTDALAEFRDWHRPVFQHRRLITCMTPDYESPYFLALLADVDINSVNWEWWTSLNISTIYYHPPLHDALLAVPTESLNFYVHGYDWIPHDARWSKEYFEKAAGEL